MYLRLGPFADQMDRGDACPTGQHLGDLRDAVSSPIKQDDLGFGIDALEEDLIVGNGRVDEDDFATLDRRRIVGGDGVEKRIGWSGARMGRVVGSVRTHRRVGLLFCDMLRGEFGRGRGGSRVEHEARLQRKQGGLHPSKPTCWTALAVRRLLLHACRLLGLCSSSHARVYSSDPSADAIVHPTFVASTDGLPNHPCSIHDHLLTIEIHLPILSFSSEMAPDLRRPPDAALTIRTVTHNSD